MKYLLILNAILCSIATEAQFPQNSIQWNLQWADEFNYNPNGTLSKAAQLWYLDKNWNTTIKNENTVTNYGDHFTDGPNIEVSHGTLKITLTKRTTPITYLKYKDCDGNTLSTPQTVERWYDSDWIVTDWDVWEDNTMNFGYYEMRLKVPNASRLNGHPKYEGVGFGWWMFQGHQPNFSPDVCVTELDFIELSGKDLHFTHNYHFGYVAEERCMGASGWPIHVQNYTDFADIQNFPGSPSLEEYADFRREEDVFNTRDQDGYHTMSCEVTPQKITWYMDGKYLQSTTGSWDEIATLPDIPYLYMEIGMATHEGFNADLVKSNNLPCGDPPTIHTQLPYTVEMDYVRYYKFKCDDGQNRTEVPNLGITFGDQDIQNSVYKSISIGNGVGASPRLSVNDANPDNDNMTLRAVEGIELLPGFEVELGAEFYADSHECGL
jgi:hypothetical protein